MTGDAELPLSPARKVILVHGIYTVEKDEGGRYYIMLPDGRRDQGLTLEDLRALAMTLRRISRIEKEASARLPPPRTGL